MYEKQLYGRKVLYFQYAPPLTRLDDTSDDARPNPPFKNSPLHMCSVYYYWWAFLRENEDYIACCEKGGKGKMASLYADFGDVRDDKFMPWWISTGRALFCEPPAEQIETFLSPPREHDNEKRVLLSIPISGDIERTIAELRQLLKPIYKGKRGSDYRGSKARYKIESKPVLTSLHQHLLIYQAKKQNPDMRQYEIAELVGISYRTSSDKDTSAAMVRRYQRQAEALVRNVGEGRFPDFS